MKEVVAILRKKGQTLINELETSNMFARNTLEACQDEKMCIKLEAEIALRKQFSEKIRTTFEIEQRELLK